MEATYTKTNETKGTWLYTADSDNAFSRNIYLSRNTVAELGSPEHIKLTVEAV